MRKRFGGVPQVAIAVRASRGRAQSRRQSSRLAVFRGPKQHELDQRDFDAYAEQLKVLSDRHPGRVQIVFSVADLKTHFEATDEVWDPSYRLGTELRFLGPVARKGEGTPD